MHITCNTTVATISTEKVAPLSVESNLPLHDPVIARIVWVLQNISGIRDGVFVMGCTTRFPLRGAVTTLSSVTGGGVDCGVVLCRTW